MPSIDSIIKSEAAASPQSLPITNTWASLARSYPRQVTSQPHQSPPTSTSGNLHSRSEPYTAKKFAGTYISASKDETKQDFSGELMDSAIDMARTENTSSVEDFALSSTRKRKSATHPSGLDRDAPKRRKGGVRSAVDDQKRGSGTRKRRRNYMSEEEAEEFRRRQPEYYHDNRKNVISQIPRFTRGQKKRSKNLVEPAKPQPVSGLLSPSNKSLSEDETQSEFSLYEGDRSASSESDVQCSSQASDQDLSDTQIEKRTTSGKEAKSKQHKASKEKHILKIRSKKKYGVQSPDVEVDTGVLLAAATGMLEHC
ncbi:hypothetical protein ONS96_014746 [Cadophora gregata f. sp. sojae]|nr:hypothetical protein ONS96_014746 [Cadophora gregata f. sp. sojae]